MKLTDDRINFLSHKILTIVKTHKVLTDETKILRCIKDGFYDYFKREDDVDKKVRQKISTLKRGVSEGTQEWDILYRQYFNEEMMKQGLS